jgi:NOL1/NOP2/sun family putative RNA methylase
MLLPDVFTQEMFELFSQFNLAGEFPAFLASFQSEPNHALRANRRKVRTQDLRRLLASALDIEVDQLKPVSWADDGFYYPAELQPGRLPLHAAGLFYIQEPSAMLPAMVLDVNPGDRVLDLCAAPGGKACKIAAELKGEGLLWANEISSERIKALLHNLEQTGCENCIITRETPGHLADSLGEFFDKILVDAPCSGQGMFRRDPSAIGSFLSYGSRHCAGLQRQILAAAWRMLRPGGILVYSTCTFSILENEAMVLWMEEEMPGCRIEAIDKRPGVSGGLPLAPGMTGTARIWPHLSAGEGHFCAKLRKDTTGLTAAPDLRLDQLPVKEAAAGDAQLAWESFDRFCQETLNENGREKISRLLGAGQPRFARNALHILPFGLNIPSHLYKIKTGLYLGQVRPVREGRLAFEPSQAFLLSLQKTDLRLQIAGPAGSDLVSRYLRGETMDCPERMAQEKSHYAAVLLAGLSLETDSQEAWPLGWVKIQDGKWLKNLYPGAWRASS